MASQYRYGHGLVQLLVTLVDPQVSGWTVPRRAKVDVYRYGLIRVALSDLGYTATNTVVDGMRECVAFGHDTNRERIRIEEELYQRILSRLADPQIKQVGPVTITS